MLTRVLANASAWLPVCLNLGVLLFLCLPMSCLPQVKYSPRTVKTAYGDLRGIIYSRGGTLVKDVEAFLGVPYASAPVASLRFMPPLTPSRWSGVRVAEKMGPVCPQILPDIANRSEALSKMPLLKFTRFLELSKVLTNMSEDCLFLNIFLPRKDERRAPPSRYTVGGGGGSGGESIGGSDGASSIVPGGLAIVVILQGESWEWGSGNLIDGSALASYGQVMVITINYRLGVLGFLQTSSQQGNYAIMDIVAALHWIRENAGAFGGDVNRVTLLGHRTGAVLANFLMLAPVASELFHRVILLSGSSLSPWSFQRQSKNNVKKLAEHLRCLKNGTIPAPPAPSIPGLGPPSVPFRGGGPMMKPGVLSDTLPDVSPCLRQISRDELLQAVNKLLFAPRFLARFGPLIDSTVVKSDFVAEMKFDTSGHFSRVPLLLGTATVESFGELNTEDIEDGLAEAKRDRILRTFVRNVFVYHLNEIYSTIKNEYTDWEKPRKDFIDVRDSILNILSDGLTVAPLVQVANTHSAKGNAKTFLFHFQYEPDQSVYPNRIGSITEDLMEFAVGHALLEPSHEAERSLPAYSKDDAKVSKSLVHYLTNFIISGDPNSGYDGSSVEDAQLPFWDSYDPINQLYLEIGAGEPRMRSHYRGHKMALWLNLIPQLHQSGGPDVLMLHHNFREERPEFYEGIVREQLKHAVIDDPPTFPAAGSGSLGYGVRPPQLPPPFTTDFGDDDDTNSDYDNEDDLSPRISKSNNHFYPTLSPAVMSTSECPPNATNSSVGGVGLLDGNERGSAGSPSADRDLVRQLAAAHYHSYGTALGVTIGVGCCLLLLNLLIFLAIYHQKTHNVPPPNNSGNPGKDHVLHEDEENPMPLPSSLSRPRSHSHSDMRHIGSGATGSMSVPALYSDNDVGDEFDDDIVQELRECTGGHASSHSTFRMASKELSSSSGFSSPSIPDPPPPPRSVVGGAGAVTFASLGRGSVVRVLRRDDSREYTENGTC